MIKNSFSLIVVVISLLIGCTKKEIVEKEPYQTPVHAALATLVDTAETTTIEQTQPEDREPVTMMSVDGPRILKEVEAEIKHHLIGINYWYYKDVQNSDSRTERVTIQFDIDQFGIVSNAKLIETSFEDFTFPNRVVADIPHWQFMKMPGGSSSTTVTYPITFRPKRQLKL